MTRLEVAAILAAEMIRHGSGAVSDATGVEVDGLLDMIDGGARFNRRVLRYLSVKEEDDRFVKTAVADRRALHEV